jgi:hypothetical protein
MQSLFWRQNARAAPGWYVSYLRIFGSLRDIEARLYDLLGFMGKRVIRVCGLAGLEIGIAGPVIAVVGHYDVGIANVGRFYGLRISLHD